MLMNRVEHRRETNRFRFSNLRQNSYAVNELSKLPIEGSIPSGLTTIPERISKFQSSIPNGGTSLRPPIRPPQTENVAECRRLEVGLIRFGGHLSKGGYDVRKGRHTEPATAPALHG
jgi:hypothetical protein